MLMTPEREEPDVAPEDDLDEDLFQLECDDAPARVPVRTAGIHVSPVRESPYI
jgi:hypothetical protein